jgi:phosphatidylglycerol:prolipoprotein diacylglycerol transferase
MFPILFKIGQYSFSSLGFLVGIGFFLAFFLIWRRLKEVGLEEEKVVDSFLFSSLAAFFAARIFYIGGHFDKFGLNLGRWFYINRFPGLSFWGAIVGFLGGFYYFARKEKWNYFKIGDELVFGLVPFAVLVQVGMFFDGANLGNETGLFWGIFFPGNMVRRHPISLFQAGFFLVLWLWLLRSERRWRGWSWYKSQKQGFLVLAFLILSSFFNFLLAFLKPAGLYSVLLEKIISFLVFLSFGVIFYFRSGGRPKKFLKKRK